MAEQRSDILVKEGFAIDSGIHGARLPVSNDKPVTIQCAATDLLWVSAIVNDVVYHSSTPAGSMHLHQSDATLLLWPKQPWTVNLASSGNSVIAVFRITLDALHRMLAVDFKSNNSSDAGRMDYTKFARMVHMPPTLLRNLERLFIQSEQSVFRAIAQRGLFLNAFAQMLELLYGSGIDQCPFHIDSETERKIRAAQQLLVSHLHEVPDLQTLALEVDLPKNVLKEGFGYIFGKSIPAYIQDYKFEKAATMLESGKYLIKEVAFEIGYQNPSHFISAFKQRFGTTPKQWLKQFSPSEKAT